MAHKEITPDMAGCWFDSHRGIYIYPAVIREAQEYGFRLTQEEETAVSDYEKNGPYLRNSSYEIVLDLSVRIENYLTDLAPEGFWIGFNDGDFGMYPIEEETLPHFFYVVDLNERGEFAAHVDNEQGETVFQFSNNENGEIWLITDGFMRHCEDLDGLKEYLESVVIGEEILLSV